MENHVTFASHPFLVRSALALLLCCGAAATSPALADEALTKLSVGADPDFRPISFMGADGTLTGYDVDFAQALGSHMSLKVDYQGMAWDGIIPALQADKINAITNLAITDARKKVVDFSKPIMKQSIVAVVKASGNQSVSADDLKSLKVGVMTGTSAATTLAALPGVSPTTYNTVIDAYNDLLLGRIDVVVVESVNGSYLAESQFKGKLNVVVKPLTADITLNGVAVRHGSDKAIAQINDAIDKMKADGTLKTLSMKWFGTDANVPE
jgi:cystine transport system substrate-binding protein